MKIFLTNLGKYVEGELVGLWLTLLFTDEEFSTALKKISIGGRYEEYFITDYENDLGLKVGEYESLNTLNEVAKCIDDLNANELQILRAVVEMDSPDVADMVEIIANLDNYTLHGDIKTYHDLGRYMIHDSGDFNVYTIETLEPYLNYESYGYDHSCNVEGKLTSYGWLERCT